MDENAPITLDTPLYLCKTMVVENFPGDRTGLTSRPDAHTSSHLIVDGPFTTPALAERALDQRIENLREGLVTLHGPLEIGGIGMHDEHGGVSSWVRKLTWHDFFGTGLGDHEGWQMVEVVRLDQLPR